LAKGALGPKSEERVELKEGGCVILGVTVDYALSGVSSIGVVVRLVVELVGG
jgi:hypothetical protein